MTYADMYAETTRDASEVTMRVMAKGIFAASSVDRRPDHNATRLAAAHRAARAFCVGAPKGRRTIASALLAARRGEVEAFGQDPSFVRGR